MPERQKEKSSGLSVQTLLISAAAAAAAATVVPLFWERGTIFATAMTPVIVALFTEGLRKPVQHVSSVAPRVARRSGTGAAVRRFEPTAADTVHHERVGARGDGPERFDPLPPNLRDDAPEARDDDPYGLRKADRRGPRLKIALVTGVLAFLIAAGAVTASELTLFGGSVASNQRTSLFGGSKKRSTAKDEKATPTPTPTASEAPAGKDATPTPTPSATPPATPTPAVNLTPSPQPTTTPGAATPAPTP